MQSLKGKNRELVEEMKKYDLGRVLRVSETKWKDNGAMEIEDCYVVYSGVRDGRAKADVTVFLSEDMSRCARR